MAKLTFNDLQKPLPKSNILRYTVVNEKIKKKDPFELDTGKSVILNYLNDEVKDLFLKGNISKLKQKYNNNVFKSGLINYKITDLFKSSEFGGGKGSGGGAEDTDRNESALCLYTSLIFNVFKKEMPDTIKISKKDFQKAYTYCNVTSKFEDLIDLPNDWVISSIRGANQIYKKFRGQNYIFYKGTKPVEKIKDLFNSLNRNENAFGNINKWSPADIYLINNKGLSLIEKLNEKTIRGLNRFILDSYLKKDIVGISYKKIEGSGKYSEFNIEKTNIKTKYISEQIMAESKKDIFESLDVYINHTLGKMQFRNFGGESSFAWQGENKGSTAAQGKISLGPLNFILKQHNIEPLIKNELIKNLSINPTLNHLTNFYNMAKKIIPSGTPKSQQEFNKKFKNVGTNWRYSKYMGLSLIDKMKKLSQLKKDDLMTDIYLYAASKSSFSAAYGKVE